MKLDLGWLWHGLGGAGIDAAVAVPCKVCIGLGWAGFPAALVLGIFGYLRERRQHPVSLSLRQWVEALAWPAGALVPAILVALIV